MNHTHTHTTAPRSLVWRYFSLNEVFLDWLSTRLWCRVVSAAGCSSSAVKPTAQHTRRPAVTVDFPAAGRFEERETEASQHPDALLCSAPQPLRAARYVGEKLSDRTTSPARLGEIGWGRMKGGGGREREREECGAQRLFP